MPQRLTRAVRWLRSAAGCALACAALSAHADHPIRFEHLDTEKGLPQNTVMTTLQDSRGFMWFATEDGLARFDGYDFVRYARNRSDPNGLTSSFIWDVAEDRNGDLWVAAKDGGVARWSRQQETFTTFRHDPTRSDSLSSDAARTLLVASDGSIWVGTIGGGLNRLDPSTQRVTRFRNDPRNSSTLASDIVTALHEDTDGTIWVGTDNGLQQLAIATGRFSLPDTLAGSPLATARISTIRPDGDGSLWVGTFNAGIHRLDLTRSRATSWRADGRDDALTNDEVRDVLVDSTGRVWVATADGLNLLERGDAHFSRYRRSATDPTSLPDNYVMSLHEDRSGLIWVGTRAGGVSRFNTRSWSFGLKTPSWLDGAYVMAFEEDDLGRLWIGTLGEGLRRYDPRTRQYATLGEIFGPRVRLPDTRVMSLLTDRNGGLWIGTMGRGVLHVAADGRTQQFESRPNDRNSLSANGIMSMLEDRDGRVWLGTFGGGINIVDPRSRQVQRLRVDANDPTALPASRATALLQDESGYIWAGFDGGGLGLLSAEGQVLRIFRQRANDPKSLGANTVYAIHQTRDGRIWVGTAGGGLNEVMGDPREPNNLRFRSITKADGLAGDVVYGIHSDAQGMLWLSSDSGVTRYYPVTGEASIFRRVHGLQGDEFNFGAHFRTRSGEICFGGPFGFNVFDPLDIQSRSPAPGLAVTRIEIMNRPLTIGLAQLSGTGVTLEHDQRVVAFEFAALDYNAPALNRYQARLDGFDSEWTDLGHHRRISYTNLGAGQYRLQVRAANSDGVWSDTVLSVPIRMHPAPWLTTTAKWVYTIVLTLILLMLWRAQQHKHARAARMQALLEAEVAARTAELREQNVELARLSRAKSDFLSRMSHEIRTPLNGVIGTVELLSRTPLSPRQNQLTATTRNSAQLLLTIVNEILDLARVESGKIEIEAKEFDLGALLEETGAALAAQARDKDVELIVAPLPYDRLMLVGDALRLRQVLLNLIGNALKFTDHGEVFVDCHIDIDANDRAGLRIDVRDTGIGMTPAVLGKIFDPFSQADESTTRRYGGTGLGLAICRELTELMGGTLQVSSELGAGSVFSMSLSLPIAASGTVHATPALSGLRTRMWCRRENLQRSLAAQLSMWGAEVRSSEAARDVSHPDDVWIVDAETSAADEVSAALRALPTPRPALIVLARPKLLVDLDARGYPAPYGVVSKPIQREALQDALLAASNRVLTHEIGSSGLVQPNPQEQLCGHVLLVEDNAVNALIAESMLQELGCTVAVATDGALAVARASSENFDVILMDRHMPQMDGVAAARLIQAASRTDQRRIPIIALTADTSPRQQEECRAAGMDGFLGKPFTVHELYAALAPYLTTRSPPDRATAAVEPRSPTTIDPRALDQVRELDGPEDRGLVARLVTMYLADSHRLTTAIETAAMQGDWGAMGRDAHTLKSASANVGAIEVVRLANALEELAHNPDTQRARALASELVGAQRQAALCLQPMTGALEPIARYG